VKQINALHHTSASRSRCDARKTKRHSARAGRPYFSPVSRRTKRSLHWSSQELQCCWADAINQIQRSHIFQTTQDPCQKRSDYNQLEITDQMFADAANSALAVGSAGADTDVLALAALLTCVLRAVAVLSAAPALVSAPLVSALSPLVSALSPLVSALAPTLSALVSGNLAKFH